MTPEARAAKERKQKIFVIVGGLLLLGLVAFQLPRLLGGSDTPEATAGATAQLDGASGSIPAQAAPTALVDGSGNLSPAAGKLRSLSTFSRKDPFVQQVKPDAQPEAPPATGVGVTKPDKGSFELAAKPAAPTATVISVNGAPQAVEPGEKFPTGDPIFVLVTQQPKTKSAVIGVVGGAYSDGDKTAKLHVGKPLVLVNTATGAKYRLVLISVGTSDAATPAP